MPDTAPEGQYLCHVDEIAERQARGFGPFGTSKRKIVVVRKDGRYFGWLDSCPHYSTGTPMAWKTDAYLNGERTHLTCHSHGALFEIETGDCVLGPCLGQTLTRVNIRISDEGGIFVATSLTEEKK
ncbi:Rieske (2Fe-2S) protein [Allorhizobium undicola]|uniref:Rieske (2Fe-2S) protein n=1 Tax=Allorhizobium undicola TaxID=78527 RepID=UPI003D34FE4F